jgi:hypothetical protein
MTVKFHQRDTGLLVLQGLLVITVGLALSSPISAKGEDASPKEQTTTRTQTSQSSTETLDPKERVRILTEYGRAPLQFEANVGQVDPKVRFFARGKKYDLYLLQDKVVFAYPELMPGGRPGDPARQKLGVQGSRGTRAHPESYVSMRLLGSRSGEVIGRDRLPGTVNYFIGNDPQKWRRKVPVFAGVEYPELIPGVDLDFHGVRQQWEFDLIVHPGTDISKIGLAFDGARKLRVDGSGNLLLYSRSGQLQLLKPVAYQEVDGKRIPVDAEFVRKKHKAIGFRIGAYDRRRELVIDPSVVYSSYLGGSSQDEALGVALDNQGFAYITGATSSPDFPIFTNVDSQFTGTIDAFVTKLDLLRGLVFSTYMGGSSTAFATAISVIDIPLQQAVYVAGYTDSSDLPIPPGTSQFGYNGGLDAFVLMFDLSGDLTNGTYFGGTKDDVATGISIDAAGNAWITGWTTSSPGFSGLFPLVNNLPGQDHLHGPMDAFVAEITQSTVFIFSSYLGGSQKDFASAIAIDNPNSARYNVYVTGGTNSPDFPTTRFALQTKCGTDGLCNGGKDDAFVTALNCLGGNCTYDYSTFLGGEDQDIGYGIVANLDGNAYLTGQTSSTQFPTTSGAYQSSLAGPQDAFVTQVSPDGSALAYSTFLGGSAKDGGLGIAVDSSGNIYVTGRTLSTDFPTLNATQPAIGGGQDAFVSAFVPVNNTPTLAFSTFLGGSGDEDLAGGGIAVDTSQNTYVVGDTNSSNFTVTPKAYQKKFRGSGTCVIQGMQAPCEDAFITKILTLNNPTLTVNMTGSGDAVVTSSPPGIICNQIPGSCQANFNFGTQVTLTEQPTNTTFNGWGGACAGMGDCVVTLTSSQTVSADFTFNQTNIPLMVVITGTGNGEIDSSPQGISCIQQDGQQQGTCFHNFPQGTTITLTANPNSDSTFAGWPGNLNCQGIGPCTFILNNAMTVQAEIDIDEPVLTVIATGDPNAGIVISHPSGISCISQPKGRTCTTTFPPGTTVTLDAEASGNYMFTGWNSSVCSGTGECTFTLNSNQLVKASFFDGLDVALPGTGTGSVVSSDQPPKIDCPKVACSASYGPGTTVTLTATPDSTSTFDGWGGVAASCGTQPMCTVTINNSLVAVSATFTLIYVPPPPPFSLTASPPGGATVPVGGSTAYGLTLVSFNGFTDTMSLTCTVQPASSSAPGCTLVPASVNLGSNQAASSTLTISAGGVIARNAPGNGSLASYELAGTTLMFSFVGGLWTIPGGNLRSRLRNHFQMTIFLVLAALAILVGCGGGAKSSGSATTGVAQPGNYVVTVTATGSISQASQSITIPVTVQ